jgi:PAS domain S-box-containing protein
MDKKKILIVEDEAIVAEDLRRNLEALDYHVVGVASSGEQALAHVHRDSPDLVLMDIVLQGDLNGIETAELIRVQDHIPVIYLTAYSDSQTLERAKISEPYGYILKPFEVRELHSTIEIALYKNQAEKRLQHLNGILRAIRNVNQLIVQEKERGPLIEKACRLLTEGRGYFNAYIALVTEEGGITAAAAAGKDIDVLGVPQIVQHGVLPECMRRAWEQTELLVIEGPYPECSDCPLFHHDDERGALVTPLVHHPNCYGVLGVLLPAAMARDEEELALFQELAADLSLALYKMDIEEREQRVQEELRASEAKYRLLIDNAQFPVVVASLADARILFMNARAADILGVPLSAAVGESAPHYWCRPEERRRFLAFLQDKGFVKDFETDLRTKSGKKVVALISANLIEFEGQAASFAVFQDITARKRAEDEVLKYQEHLESLVAERTQSWRLANESLQREITQHQQTEQSLKASEARFRAIFEGAPLGICLRDQDGRVLAINPALKNILGYGLEEYNQMDWSFLHPDEAGRTRGLFQDVLQGRRDKFEVELRAFHKNGGLVWRRVHISKIKGPDDHTWFFLTLIEDISADKQAKAEIEAYQERLRALAAELTMTEERERRRLANNLHDNIGQTLALLQIKLGSLKQEVQSPKGTLELDETRDLLAQVIRTTRSLTLEMGLSILHELGLESGLEWLGEKHQEQHGLQVEVDCERLPVPLDDPKKTMLFRAVQELLANIVKHAKARHAKISLARKGDQLILTVRDDGIGFEVSNLTAVAGFGLFSIAERVSNLGGQLNIESAPNQGSRVIITLSWQ